MNNQSAAWLVQIIKWGRIAIILAILFLIHLYIGDVLAGLFIIGLLLHELWDIQMSLISIEDNTKKDDSLGEILTRNKPSIKR